MKVRAIAIAGPTASGKTGLALAIAAHLKPRGGAEIISVDSALVYKSMDIGTAKPTAAELAAVPHHLIDIRDPLNAYSAAEFARDALVCIKDIASRGKVPLLVGGTMLYFKALLEGLNDMPAADPAIRAHIQAEAEVVGWPAMHTQLQAVDPVTAARLAPADSQRISRALEVFKISGKPLSSFQRNTNINTDRIDTDLSNELNFHNVSMLSLEPLDRAWLHKRIEQRFDDMLAHGFLDEVKRLRARGDLQIDLPAMRCVGYRQAWEALDGSMPMAELRDRGVFATRQLAKRQLTWLRSMPDRSVLQADGAEVLPQALKWVDAQLA
ncbi:tRNA (adenosine(37)-N6)-dimethylallyltransferase MiaA [Limnohabitans sp. Rim11]|uniref:tRNA (adenosine(37)-N6)-dimethylallyltransferase MiaA n=1 Tax=Limnohabitans sp. Rim11 TaxID=1100719 RepID=UPI000AD34055|nr:tRNA (adenosine(37)-N6)-dimethylallyltransferase MiaA [Limnohabitans sp. Rim11]